jgi:hypothetical protein
MKITSLLTLVAILLIPVVLAATQADDHGHVEVTELDKIAHLLQLDEWLERLEDGWVPVSLVEDVLEEEALP